jgi:hypothetical protein
MFDSGVLPSEGKLQADIPYRQVEPFALVGVLHQRAR